MLLWFMVDIIFCSYRDYRISGACLNVSLITGRIVATHIFQGFWNLTGLIDDKHRGIIRGHKASQTASSGNV